MRINFGIVEFLAFIGVMIPAVFVLAGIVIAVMAFRFKPVVDVSEGNWNEEADLQDKSKRLVSRYLTFGGTLFLLFLVPSVLEVPGDTWLVSVLLALVASAVLLWFFRILWNTRSFYISITHMVARKHVATKVKAG